MKKPINTLLVLLISLFLFSSCDKNEILPAEDPVYVIESVRYFLKEGDGVTSQLQYIDLLKHANRSDHVITASSSGEIILYQTSGLLTENRFRDIRIIGDNWGYQIPSYIKDGEIITEYSTKPIYLNEDTIQVYHSDYDIKCKVPGSLYYYSVAHIEIETIVVSFEVLLQDVDTGEELIIEGKWFRTTPEHRYKETWIQPITENFDWDDVVLRPIYNP
ncbi:MAG: hypothetical protein LIO85_02300 [Rikenellaceae bacterium]|nr:hypothetical protein [Rikenellaceae bacterium]